MENIVLEALKTRRSVRKFTGQQITEEELTAFLEAGTYAPNGMGRQDSWIVAVQSPEIIERLTELNRQYYVGSGDPYYGAKTIILVFGTDPIEWRNSIYDGALVMGNMMIAAHSLGLGSCWINREREIFSTDAGKQMMKEFGLREGLIGIGALAIGYPDGPLKQPHQRKEGYFRIIK